ncbi:MAG TPA: hypothetical protein VGC61_06495, partial [Pyrinomonadaceae bacterium]
YQAIGTMAQALDQHAERAYAELTTPRQQQICEKLFKALTDKATDPRGVRRPTTLGTLCALADATPVEVTEVIDVFRKPSRSFLMPPTDETLQTETVVDISHESLMRVWERLKTWSHEEAQSAQIYRRLAETATLHSEGKAGLWDDPDLQLALDWKEKNQPNQEWARRYHPEFAVAMKFLDNSAAARDKAVAEKETQRRRAIRRTRLTAAVFGFLFLVSFVALVFANQQRTRAKAALKQVENNAEAMKNNAVQVARADEQSQIAATTSRRAQMEALKAEKEREEAIELKRVAEAKTKEATQQRLLAEGLRKEALEQKLLAEEQTRKVAELQAQTEREAKEANAINSLTRGIDDALQKNEVEVVITKASEQFGLYSNRKDPRGMFESLTVLSPAYLKMERPKEAIDSASSALEIMRQNPDLSDPRRQHENLTTLSAAYMKAAYLKEDKGERDDTLHQALSVADRALEAHVRSVGETSLALIPDLNNLAAVTDRLNENSEKFRIRIVDIQKQALQNDNLQLLSHLNNL